MEQARSIRFTVPGSNGSPSVEIQAVEAAGGKIDFTVTVLQTASTTADLRGLFFDLADATKLTGLSFSQSGNKVSDFDTVDVIQLKNGANMNGAASPFDVGFEFGTAGIAKDDIKTASFTLDNAAHNLTLDDIAHTQFGLRLTSIGSPTDTKRSEKDGAKLVATSHAAPHAFDDAMQIFEDGASGLGDARSSAQGVKLLVLANDSDADAADVLKIVEVENGAHGTVKIVDGPDADNLPGDALEYTPVTDYAGSDSFNYRISDGKGGFDTAKVSLNITPVADKPEMQIQVLDAADAVNQVRVLVTATQGDNDGSEYLTALTAGALPAGVSISPASVPVQGQPGQIQQEFMITLPADGNVNYSQLFSADSREVANGDTETATASLPIQQFHKLNEMDAALKVDDASLWANGNDPQADINGPFVGIELGPDLDLYAWPLYYSATAQVKTGLQSFIDIQGGTLDAQLTYDVTAESVMNKTTDTLKLTTTATLSGGSFSSQGPGGSMGLDWVFGYELGLKVGLDFDTPDIDLIPTVDFIDMGIKDTWTLVNLFDLAKGDPSISLDLLNGTSGLMQWADVSMNGAFNANTQTIKGTGSANFLSMQSDLDAALFSAVLGFGLSPFDIPVVVYDGIDLDIEPETPDIAGFLSLFDMDLNAALGLQQQLELSAKTLTGKVVFENGAALPITFGDELLIQNAAATYDALAQGGNGNGIVEYKIVLDGVATLHNKTDLSYDRGFSLDLFKIDLDVDLEYGVDSYNGPVEYTVFHTDDQTVSLIGVADETTDLTLGSWGSGQLSTEP
ncbi:Ig-like domain-containing protein [Inhella proteolytica]|uniref:Cadherin-like domain-containing protein n=1 Tax=Inhella proteolytica TaxID=2795029 RepID=A0A931J7N6_9BURK|nr:Ig-like domain-containing protein [Inhella proteolytica]MBH9577852.1 cadherin-like domain-containing protein [Inhella proteolytica]